MLYRLIYLHWRTLETQRLIQCKFLPEDKICLISDNETGKTDQLSCIRYKIQNDLALDYHDVPKILE